MINKSFASPHLKGDLFNSFCPPFLFVCQEVGSQVINITKVSSYLLLYGVFLCQSVHFTVIFSITLVFHIYRSKLLSMFGSENCSLSQM